MTGRQLTFHFTKPEVEKMILSNRLRNTLDALDEIPKTEKNNRVRSFLEFRVREIIKDLRELKI